MKRERSTGYHEGELAAQERAGFRFDAGRIEPVIGGAVPRGAGPFLASLELLFVGAADPEGAVWASVLYGTPGFLSLPDAHTLRVAALPTAPDPLAEALRHPAGVGTLAIDFAGRRRFRVNGRSTPTPDGLLVAVDQAYGNCPQYIQRRTPDGNGTSTGEAALLATGTALTASQQGAVAEADTFFVASASAAGDADVSHRGGNPGFVRVLRPDLLAWPDYSGNKMLMTLGNFVQNPAAGLLFVDWDDGTTLHLTGSAEIRWGEDAVSASMPGAERYVVFTVTRTVQVSHAGAPHWSRPEFSRFNPPVPG